MPCRWALKSIQKSCVQCMDKHIRCMVGDVTISQWVSRKNAGLPSKRHHITMPVVLELESNTGNVQRPTLVAGDQASWAIAHMLGDLVEVQEQIWSELEYLQFSSEQVKGWLEELADHSKLMADAGELLTCGKCYLRVQEMGKPDGTEEVEVTLKPRKSHLGINELERGMAERQSPEVVPEVVPEGMAEIAPEEMPEVVPEVDVEMTLQ